MSHTSQAFSLLFLVIALVLGDSVAWSNSSLSRTRGSDYQRRENLVPVDAEPLARIKVLRKHNRLFIPIEVSPGDTQLMMLDSGSTTTVFFDQETEPAVDDQTAIPIYFPVLDLTTRGYALPSYSFKIGGQPVSKHTAASVNKGIRLKVEPEMSFHGLIGRQLFQDYIVEFDMKRDEISLWPRGADLSLRFKTLRPIVQDAGRPVVELEMRVPWQRGLNEQRFMIDTGYPGTMVFWRTNKFDHMLRKISTIDAQDKLFAMISDIGFSGARLRSAPSFVMGRSIHAEAQDGIIGMALLSMFHVAIDIEGGQMWLNNFKSRKFGRRNAINLLNYVPIEKNPILVELTPRVMECLKNSCMAGTNFVMRRSHGRLN